LILLLAGLFIQIPIISAQEVQSQQAQESDSGTATDTTERTFFYYDDSVGVTAPTGPTLWTVIRMILVLALVAAAIYGIVFLLKKASKAAPESDPFLKVIASSHLGANRYAQIVSVGSKAWLIGSSDGGVNLISEIEDKEIIDAMLLEESRKSEQAPGRFPDFLSILRRLGVRAQTQAPTADDIRKRRERLKEM